jgi:hypothetical protein
MKTLKQSDLNRVRNKMWKQVKWNQVNPQVYSQVYSQVYNQVKTQVWDQIYENIKTI